MKPGETPTKECKCGKTVLRNATQCWGCGHVFWTRPLKIIHCIICGGKCKGHKP